MPSLFSPMASAYVSSLFWCFFKAFNCFCSIFRFRCNGFSFLCNGLDFFRLYFQHTLTNSSLDFSTAQFFLRGRFVYFSLIIIIAAKSDVGIPKLEIRYRYPMQFTIIVGRFNLALAVFLLEIRYQSPMQFIIIVGRFNLPLILFLDVHCNSKLGPIVTFMLEYQGFSGQLF